MADISIKTVTKVFRANLAKIAEVQLFTHHTPEHDIRDGFCLIVAAHMLNRSGGIRDMDIAELESFMESNRAQIEPVVSEAIQRAKDGAQ